MARAKRLHVWARRRPSWDIQRCMRGCGAFRWLIFRPGTVGKRPAVLYGRDCVRWSTARVECAPPARGVAALIPEVS